MLVLIEGGEVLAPEPIGAAAVLLSGDRILKVGPVDGRALAALGVDVEVIDARGCVVIPGLLDPHEHLLGGSGERGFASQTPEIAPRTLFEQLREVVREHGFPLERALPLVTSNTARILKLPRKGALRAGHDADVVVLEQGSLEIVEVVARGRRMVKAGRLAVTERFLERSNRKVELHGRKQRER